MCLYVLSFVLWCPLPHKNNVQFVFTFFIILNVLHYVTPYKINVREYWEGTLKNGQSRETGNKGYTRRWKTKQKHNIICVGHHYMAIQMICTFVVWDVAIHRSVNKVTQSDILAWLAHYCPMDSLRFPMGCFPIKYHFTICLIFTNCFTTVTRTW
jgi:hypothetical protein